MEPVDQIVASLVEMIRQRPILETQNVEDEDFILQGLFELL